MAPEWRKRHRARDLMYSYLTGPKPCVLPAAAGRMKSHPLLNLLNQAENCSRFWPGCAVTSVGPAVSQTEVRADAGSEIRLQQAACSRLFPCSHAAAVPAVESGLPWSHPFFWRWCCVDVEMWQHLLRLLMASQRIQQTKSSVTAVRLCQPSCKRKSRSEIAGLGGRRNWGLPLLFAVSQPNWGPVLPFWIPSSSPGLLADPSQDSCGALL